MDDATPASPGDHLKSLYGTTGHRSCDQASPGRFPIACMYMSLPEIETLVHNVVHPPVRDHEADLDIDAVIEGRSEAANGVSAEESQNRVNAFLSPHATSSPLHSIGLRCGAPSKLLREMVILLSGAESHDFVLSGNPSDRGIDVDELVKQNLDACDNGGKTALHQAAQWGSAGVVHELCRLGAAVNIQDYRGRTPLHAAVLHPVHEGSEEVIRCLILNKADPLISDHHGCSPLSAAIDAPAAIRELMVPGATITNPPGRRATVEEDEVASRPAVRREAAGLYNTDHPFLYDGNLTESSELGVYQAARAAASVCRSELAEGRLEESQNL
ncbi:hypothetical protein FOZ60_002218 [Perkinsus olseni]|uniref:Uncharacterized protein n=3 Tax=Perkinsus olseni TaxID=32597 RepID=A0A7J6NZL8_PEROL|nr:hypothetical protein FOZ60_002218 [Perkinsus olseni]